VGEEKLGNGAGMARQELPVRTAVEAMLNLLDDFSGGEFPMAGCRPGADPDQACDLRHFQSQLAVE